MAAGPPAGHHIERTARVLGRLGALSVLDGVRARTCCIVQTRQARERQHLPRWIEHVGLTFGSSLTWDDLTRFGVLVARCCQV